MKSKRQKKAKTDTDRHVTTCGVKLIKLLIYISNKKKLHLHVRTGLRQPKIGDYKILIFFCKSITQIFVSVRTGPSRCYYGCRDWKGLGRVRLDAKAKYEDERNIGYEVQNLFYLVSHSQMASLKGRWPLFGWKNRLFLSESECHTLCTTTIWWMKYIISETNISKNIERRTQIYQYSKKQNSIV